MSVDVRAKLAEKGLTLPITSKPIAAYVPATRTGNLVFTVVHREHKSTGGLKMRLV